MKKKHASKATHSLKSNTAERVAVSENAVKVLTFCVSISVLSISENILIHA